jgi:hypothetical protein
MSVARCVCVANGGTRESLEEVAARMGPRRAFPVYSRGMQPPLSPDQFDDRQLPLAVYCQVFLLHAILGESIYYGASRSRSAPQAVQMTLCRSRCADISAYRQRASHASPYGVLLTQRCAVHTTCAVPVGRQTQTNQGRPGTWTFPCTHARHPHAHSGVSSTIRRLRLQPPQAQRRRAPRQGHSRTVRNARSGRPQRQSDP